MRPVNGVRAADAAPLTGAGSALAVGVFGWFIAHAMTLWLVAHSHHEGASPAGNGHGYGSAPAMLSAALAVASLLAIGLSRVPARADSSGSRTGWCAITRAVGLSTLAFLATDAVEHGVFGPGSTPPALLILGALLHALLSTGASLSWLHFSGIVRMLVTWLFPAEASGGSPRVRPERRPLVHRRLLWADAVAGRAPPLG